MPADRIQGDLAMTASAQVAIHSLRQEHLSPAIEGVQQALRAHALAMQPGPMSTYIVGDTDAIFAALQEVFAGAATAGHVVMTVTVSNACPIPD